MATTELFTADDLNALPGVSGVTTDEGTMVERVVWGWLKPLLGATDRPDPVPEQLFSWALELGIIFRTNPEGLSAKEIGPFKDQYSSERRDEILRWVSSGGTTAPGAAPRPVGSFPQARAYPDPAERC